MLGSTRMDYELFRELCGKRASTLVTMATTHWDIAELEATGVGITRENEFRTKFWSDILNAGASLERIQDYGSDPKRIINGILAKAQEKEVRKMELQIQEELVDKKKRIPETEAGKKLRYTLEELEKMMKEAPTLDLEQQRQKMASVQEQLEALKVPLLMRFKGAFQIKRGSSSKK